MKKGKLRNILINKRYSIKETMRMIDRSGLGVAFIIDKENRLLGVVTDGDIRKAILRGVNINKAVEEIMNKKPIFLRSKLAGEILKLKKDKNVRKKMPLMAPVIDVTGKVKDVVFINNENKNTSLRSEENAKLVNRGIKKVLVIGGAGYLGSILCRKLLNKKYKVRVLDNLTYGDEGIKLLHKNKNFEFLKRDIRNISDVVEAIRGVDAVVHLAAIVGDPACAVDPEETLKINYLATKNITETCKYFQINRFIFASTCSVYGESPLPDEKLTEDSSLNPISLYAETKIKCEQSILEAVDENFSPTILRMATLYGYSPNMRFDLAINLLTGQAIFDKKITIFGGEQWRPWLDVEDAAQAYIACLEAPIEKVRGEIFNILSENYKIVEVGKIINSVCPEAKIEITEKAIDKRNYNVSFNKISQALNYCPRKKMTDGITEIKNVIEKRIIDNYLHPKYRTSAS